MLWLTINGYLTSIWWSDHRNRKHRQSSLVEIYYTQCDSGACGGQITKVTSNNRLLYATTSQELTATNTEATYRWITYTTNALALFETKLTQIRSSDLAFEFDFAKKLDSGFPEAIQTLIIRTEPSRTPSPVARGFSRLNGWGKNVL